MSIVRAYGQKRRVEYITSRMFEVFLDALKDSAVILLTVFLFHVLLSFIEGKIASLLEKNKKFAPALGAVFGLVPQCGTSVVGADLYLKDHLTMGTILAIFLACSDEALPILFSDFHGKWYMGFVLIGLKLVIAVAVGYAADLILGKRQAKVDEHLHHCEGESAPHIGCCHHDIEGDPSPWKEHLLHPLVHSLKIFAYVFVINFAFGTLFYFVGEEAITEFLTTNKALTPLLATLIGMIPNCASSVLLAETYIQGLLPFGALLAGLLINAGLGLFVLLRTKEKRKEALWILLILFLVSLAAGYAVLWVI